MADILLEARNLTKAFPIRRSPLTGRVKASFPAVDGISLSLYAGETLGIAGESGCGKSTLCEMLGDLQQPTSGTVFYKGRDIRKLTPQEYQSFRRNVQFIFQDPKGSMNPAYRIGQILTEPLLTLQLEKDAERRKEKARQMCSLVGLEDSVLRKYPNEISGGQCQRVAIARALITQPEVIICDEAVSALDVSVQAQILNLLNDLQAQLKMSYLFISHDISVINYMADRIAVMYRGKLVEEGSPEQVLLHPTQAYTRQLLACSFARRD